MLRRTCLFLAAMLIVALTVVGCGSSDSGTTDETQAPETATTQAPAADTSTTQAPTVTTQAPANDTATTQAATNEGWSTIATLSSSDAPWQDLAGILVSEPFTVSGEARVVLDMVDTGVPDGVILAVVPADMVTDPSSLLDAVRGATVLTLLPSAPIETVSDLDGTYVMINSVPTSSPWSLELQTQP